MTNTTSDYNDTWYTTSAIWKDNKTHEWPDYNDTRDQPSNVDNDVILLGTQCADELHNEIHIAIHQVLGYMIIFGGPPANVIAFCVWTFGPKSKQVCCAIYFMAYAAADFLLLAVLGLVYLSQYENQIVKQMLCKISALATFTFLATSNWISAVITVERALTIVFPLSFKSQTMRGRSKYVVCVIFILLLLASSLWIYLIEHECWYFIIKYDETYYAVQLIVKIIVPFLLIVVCNVVTVVTLLRHKFRGTLMASNRPGLVTKFTKIAIVTGISFALTNALIIIVFVSDLTCYDIGTFLNILTSDNGIMVYLNSLVNPIACMLFCKSAREDIKHFVCMIQQRFSRTNICTSCCRCLLSFLEEIN